MARSSPVPYFRAERRRALVAGAIWALLSTALSALVWHASSNPASDLVLWQLGARSSSPSRDGHPRRALRFRRSSCEHMFVHEPEIRTEALRLVAAGVNDCEIARRLGVARTTVRDWRRPRYFARFERCPRYSSDILDLVESTCLAQGLRPRRYARAIRLNRREDVARLLEHVGVKS